MAPWVRLHKQFNLGHGGFLLFANGLLLTRVVRHSAKSGQPFVISRSFSYWLHRLPPLGFALELSGSDPSQTKAMAAHRSRQRTAGAAQAHAAAFLGQAVRSRGAPVNPNPGFSMGAIVNGWAVTTLNGTRKVPPVAKAN